MGHLSKGGIRLLEGRGLWGEKKNLTGVESEDGTR